jgi:hypothetical protein
MDRDLVQGLVLVLVLGLIVLAIRRGYDEGFISSPNAIQCGVGMAPCGSGQKCVNGFCAITEPERAYDKVQIPLLPDGQGAPYF